MVSRAGKELLRNTIRLVGHHNKVLEEQEMWKKWELAKGLTMMVTDERRSPSTSHRMQDSKEKRKRKHMQSPKDVVAQASEKPKRSERWDHSGYLELYPDATKVKKRKAKKCRLRSVRIRREKRLPCKLCCAKDDSFRIQPSGPSHTFHKVDHEERSKSKGLTFSSAGSSRAPNQRTFSSFESLRKMLQKSDTSSESEERTEKYFTKPDTSNFDEFLEKLDPRL